MDLIVTPEEVMNLPLCEKDAHHHSRKRLGYYAHLSYYFKLFLELDVDFKRSMMIEHGVWQDEDDISFDSALTPRLPMCFEVSKAASRKWNSIAHNTKEAWKDSAIELNSCPSTDKRLAIVLAAVYSSATRTSPHLSHWNRSTLFK